MKTIQLHPASLLVGLAGGVGALLLMSQSALSTFPTGRVEVGPHPRDMVQVHEGSTFVVPPGRYFVLTGLGSAIGGSGETVLRVNGQVEAKTLFYNGGGAVFNGCFVSAVPSGLSISWGSTIEVAATGSTPGEGRAWGYLADR